MIKRTQVGSPMNFRGMMYKPINEQGVVYLFGLVSKDLNIVVESVQQGYPDCTGLRYVGKGRWERIRIEFEYNSSSFIVHGHDPKECDVIVCWEDDLGAEQKEKLAKEGVEVIDLKSRIGTDEVPDEELIDPETASKSEYDIEHHYRRKDVTENVKRLFEKLDEEIKKINPDIWDKYSKTTITYYSPEKTFVGIHLRKTSIAMEVYTNTQNLIGFDNILNHKNWGRTTIHSEQELQNIIPSLRKSFEIMKNAESEGINTGWYALTPSEKMPWKQSEDIDESEEDDEET